MREGTNSSGGSHLVRTWDHVTLPLKTKEGLAFDKIRLINEALLTKWLWRYITKKDGLWKDVIASKYVKEPLKLFLLKKH